MGTDHSTKVAPVEFTIVKTDESKPETTLESNGSHVRIVGCEGHRQCRVGHSHGSLIVQEIGRETDHAIFINLDDIFRKCFVALIKANDGMPIDEALKNGLDRLMSYDEVFPTTKIENHGSNS